MAGWQENPFYVIFINATDLHKHDYNKQTLNTKKCLIVQITFPITVIKVLTQYFEQYKRSGFFNTNLGLKDDDSNHTFLCTGCEWRMNQKKSSVLGSFYHTHVVGMLGSRLKR